jgi:hypothetical protein
MQALVVVSLGNSRPTIVVGCLAPKKRGKHSEKMTMGRGILLWLLGVPIPIIILLALIWH